MTFFLKKLLFLVLYTSSYFFIDHEIESLIKKKLKKNSLYNCVKNIKENLPSNKYYLTICIS